MMLDFDEAQKRLSQAGTPLTATDTCSLADALGRVLAQDIKATINLPQADNSAMDGYAIRFADYEPNKALPVQQRHFAGEDAATLEPGKAIRLFTGSLMPEGADTVVMQEHATETDGQLIITEAPRQHSHVRKLGEDISKGSTVVAAGRLLTAADIGILASQGVAEIPVLARLRVGVLTTGDELVPPGQNLSEAQVYNSNAPMLTALLKQLGANVTHTLHARDTSESLNQAFDQLFANCDLVLTVGGVSVGEKDLVKPTLESRGGTLDLWKVSMKPGKPVALAHVQNKPVVCLPGNPVSAFAVFVLLVSPLVRYLQGRQNVFPAIRYARLDHFDGFNKSRDEFIRVKAHENTTGQTVLEPHPLQASGIISSLPWSDGLARIPANTRITENTIVPYYSWADWLY